MKVLIATDGSEFSKAAVEVFCKVFDGSGNTHIRILSVAMPVTASAVPFEFAHEYIDEMEAAGETHAENVVTADETEIRKRFGNAPISARYLTLYCTMLRAQFWSSGHPTIRLR